MAMVATVYTSIVSTEYMHGSHISCKFSIVIYLFKKPRLDPVVFKNDVLYQNFIFYNTCVFGLRWCGWFMWGVSRGLDQDLEGWGGVMSV